jgi:predicted RNA-binding Zn-ribbon protein involved in translation (DUF1610 family)
MPPVPQPVPVGAPPPIPQGGMPPMPQPVPVGAPPPIPHGGMPPMPQPIAVGVRPSQPQSKAKKPPQSDQVKQCKNCGSALVFDPQAGCMKCPSCGYVEEWEAPLEGDQVVENDLLTDMAANIEFEGEEHIEVKCPTCGANSTFPVNEVAGLCPFCKSPIVASSKSKRSIRPSGMLPFIITSDAAQATFKQWIKSRWFLANAAKNSCLAKGVDGVYRPTWTFDFDTTCHYTGERGEYYYVTETYRDSKGNTHSRRVRKTRWRYASGTVYRFFDDLQVYASNKISRNLQEEVGPWKLLDSVNYNEDIVRGFVEEIYDVTLAAGLDEAHQKAKALLRDTVKRDIGGDEQRITTMNVIYNKSTYKQLLLPFWSSFYKFKNKSYTYLVNGQTGKGHGERPWSAWKIFFFVLSIVTVVVLGLYYLSQNG